MTQKTKISGQRVAVASPHSLAYLAQHLYRGDQNLELIGTGGVGVHLETDVLIIVNVTAL